MKNTTILLFPFLFLCASLFAQWEQTSGPAGATIRHLSESGSQLLAIAENNVIYSSNSQGGTWFNQGVLCDEPIQSMDAFGSELFVSTNGGGIFYSSNGGLIWSNIGLLNENAGQVLKTGSDLFVATQSGIFHSTNNGNTWNLSINGLTDLTVGSLATDGVFLYAGTQTAVFRSSDNGASWTIANNGISGQAFTRIWTIGNQVYAASSNGGGVSLSIDNGANWTAINNGLSNGFGSNNYSVLGHAKIATSLYIGTEGGIFVTTNNGTTWSNIHPTWSFDMAVLGTNLFSAVKHGIEKSTDNGINWSLVNHGLSNQTVLCLAVNGSGIFAGTAIPNVFTTSNNGLNWSGYHPFFAGFETNVGVNKVNALLTDANVLYAGLGGAGVQKSSDNGITWTTINNGISNTNIHALAKKDNFLFAGTAFGSIFRSSNGGSNWTEISSGLSLGASKFITAFAVIGNQLFAAYSDINGYSKVFVSTDYGLNWTNVSNELANLNGGVLSLAVRGNTLFASVGNHGIYASNNNGNNWVSIGAGLSNPTVNRITVVGNTIFAATAGGGVNYSLNNGATWLVNNTDLLDLHVHTILESNGVLYAGTNNSGVFKIPLDAATASTEDLSFQVKAQIFPNPCQGRFTLSSEEIFDQVLILDSRGSVLSELPPNQFITEITLKTEGLFFVQTIKNGQVSTYKIINHL